jgi:magnesium chelatase family protein
MHIEVPALPRQQLLQQKSKGEDSSTVRKRVQAARRLQTARGCVNAKLDNSLIDKFCELDASDLQLLETAIERLGLSARAYHRILKVARTIADLDGSEQILGKHIREAIGYRCLDRQHG